MVSSDLAIQESCSLREAIEEHKWYLSYNVGYDVGFERARNDFIVNYLVPWIEENPSQELLNHGNTLKKCVHLEDLYEFQSLAYKKAVRDDQFYLSQKRKDFVDWKSAEMDFLSNYLFNWAEKFKRAYCGHLCVDRGRCEIAENYAKESKIFNQ